MNIHNVCFWKDFPFLTGKVRKDHHEKNALTGGCHDFPHAFMVAQYGVLLSGSRDEARRAWIAGITHNADRLFGQEKVQETMHRYLKSPDCIGILSSEKTAITEAVLNHSKKNEPDDKRITVLLKDADRLANIGAIVLLRAGQFYSTIPAVDLRFVYGQDPDATFQNPRSLLHNIQLALEWETWLRTEKARELGRPYFAFLRTVISNCRFQLEETGMIPYPFPEDFDTFFSSPNRA